MVGESEISTRLFVKAGEFDIGPHSIFRCKPHDRSVPNVGGWRPVTRRIRSRRISDRFSPTNTNKV